MTGALYRHYSVMQAGWSVVNCSHGAFSLFCRGRSMSLWTLVLHVLPSREHTLYEW